MRNRHAWVPTKARINDSGRLYPPKGGVSAGSTLISTLIGRWYQINAREHARGRLVELGCGQLPFLETYEKYVTEVICTDWPSSLHGETFLDFAADLNAGIPMQSNSVDTIIASDVLEHIYRPHQLLSEMRRILRPGGTALLNMPFIYWIHEAPYDFYRYTPFAIQRMAEDAGLQPVAINSIGGGLLAIADIAGKLIQRVRGVGFPTARLLQRATLAGFSGLPETKTFPLFVGAVLRRAD